MWAAHLLPWVLRMTGPSRLLSLLLSLRLRILTLEVGAELELADCAPRRLLHTQLNRRDFCNNKGGFRAGSASIAFCMRCFDMYMAQQGKVCSCHGTVISGAW